MITLIINGKRYQAEVNPEAKLLWVIREHLQLTGTKYGCGIGKCGTCIVHINGTAAKSCLIPVLAVQGKEITTIEGLPITHPVKQAWLSAKVSQCGYCQPGQIMQAAALLSKNHHPTEQEIVNAMNGNLCRCGTYLRIKTAIQLAAQEGGK